MNKFYILIAALLLSINVMTIDTKAADTGNTDVQTEIEMSTRSVDEIVKKYRYYNGVRQYRRWNVTKGVWVDPYWINC